MIMTMMDRTTYESSSSSSSSLSSGQLTRSSVSSLSLSQLSLASSASSGWGSTDTRKAYCDLSSLKQNQPQQQCWQPNTAVPAATYSSTKPVSSLLAPTSEQHDMSMDDGTDDWGFFVDTYDRFATPSSEHSPGYFGY
jgi:hypothetical protein